MAKVGKLFRRPFLQHAIRRAEGRPHSFCDSTASILSTHIIGRPHQNYTLTTTAAARTRKATTMSGEVQHLKLSEVENICRNALSASGLNPVATAVITDVVTAAERDGCHSHGLFRVPGYCQALLSGNVDSSVQPIVHDVAPGVVRVDAGGGYAPPAILAGRDLAIQKVRENGISCLAIHNSVHFAALWWEVEAIANEGLVALAFVNSRSFVAQQPGGKRKLYGTNPMAFGFPRATSTSTDEEIRHPLVWDQASAAMARGEIQLCQRDGLTLPEGVAIDRDGQPTTCPEAALDGAQLPFGGHKGSTIAMMVELMAAGLTGSQLSFEAHDKNDDPECSNGPTNHGELIILIDPGVTSGGNDYLEHCEMLFERILEEEGARLPSTRRYANRLKTPLEGVSIPLTLYKKIIALGSGVEVST
mmetsp:Transcript_18730/g.40774  ORF Transcript_18730/g.40774 Transcript_18730/m.40774 type:complete len:418 (-) Transcript_18730:66-1319(-)